MANFPTPNVANCLLQLENDPEGWRRCALAFLEDQAWRQALAGVVPAVAAIEAGRACSVGSSTEQRLVPSRLDRGFRDRLHVRRRVRGGRDRRGRGLEIAKPKVRNHPSRGHGCESEPAQEPIREVGKIDLVDGSNGEAPSQTLADPVGAGPG